MGADGLASFDGNYQAEHRRILLVPVGEKVVDATERGFLEQSSVFSDLRCPVAQEFLIEAHLHRFARRNLLAYRAV